MLSFENKAGRIGHAEYYLLKLEIKDYSFKANGQNLFDQPVNKSIKTYKDIQKMPHNKETTTSLDPCRIFLSSKKTTR